MVIIKPDRLSLSSFCSSDSIKESSLGNALKGGKKHTIREHNTNTNVKKEA
jgi:hypothetical protein